MTLPLSTTWVDGNTVDASNVNQWAQATNYIAGSATTAASSGISTTQTTIAQMPLAANSLSAGSIINWQSWLGTVGASSSCSISYYVRVGTNGNSADTLINSGLVAVSANGASGAWAVGSVTVRTSGSGGTCIGNMSGVGSAVAAPTQTTTTVTINTTQSNYISVQAKLSTNTATFQQGWMSWGGAGTGA